MKDPTYPETPTDATNPVNPERPERAGTSPNLGGPGNRASSANPMPPETPTNAPRPMASESPVAPQSGANAAVGQRPDLVTFAAVMIFVLAGFQLTFAIVEFANAAWVAANVAGSFGGPLWIWGIIDLVLAGVAVYAGYDILRGGQFGRILGVIIAAVSAIRWFFYLPAAPLMAIVVIAVDVLIIYGLAANWEFFRPALSDRRRATI
jgi:hypothetical protein